MALLTAVSATASDDRLPAAARVLGQAIGNGDTALAERAAEALTFGYTRAALVEAVLLLAAGALAAFALTARPATAVELAKVEAGAA